ncbi:MAG: M20/M25/M40 family peptidase, partial [uncultured bacterium]
MINAFYEKLLKDFLQFKSISTDPNYRDEINKTISWLKNLFEENSFKVQILKGKTCNPVISAFHKTNQSFETILVYGHYDVQPANQEDGWFTDPFSLYEKDGRLYGRGTVDNKGQVLIHIYTVLDLIKQNKLKYNVKFLIEGNEETSNEDLPEIIKQNKKLLSCDYIIISDGELL